MYYHLDRVQKRVEKYVNDNAYSGIEWHIEKGGETLTEGKVGLADALKGTPMPDIPIYRIYSMTKPLVAAVAVMLVDEGKLRLCDPVSNYLPKFADMQVMEADGGLRPAKSSMIVEHLFTHRSGITYQWQQGNPVAPLYLEKLKFTDQYSLEELVDSLADLPLFADPGSVWHYSYSIDVLGQLVSIIENAPLGDVLRKRIFDPLGMTDTAFFVPDTERHRLMSMFGDAVLTPGVAKPPSSDGDTLHYGASHMIHPADNKNFARGGLGLFSTMPDYKKAARFLISGTDQKGDRLISKAGVSALWTNRLPEAQTPISIGMLPKYQGYGFGLGGRVMIRPNEAPFYSVKGESGWEGAGTTYFWLDPDRDITGIVMTQYLGQKFPLGEDIRTAFYQSLN